MAMMRALLIVCLVEALASAGAVSPTPQIDAGYLADVKDSSVSVNYSPSTNTTDVALGLAPPAPSGAPGVTLVFRAQFNGSTVDFDRLTGILLRAHYRILSDDRPRALRSLSGTHALTLTLDEEAPYGITLDFFPANWGYGGFAPPGDQIPVAYFSVTPADLRALSHAETIRGEVLWTRFTLTAEELSGLRTFVRQVLPPARPAS
jgi:hypothetical protein